MPPMDDSIYCDDFCFSGVLSFGCSNLRLPTLFAVISLRFANLPSGDLRSVAVAGPNAYRISSINAIFSRSKGPDDFNFFSRMPSIEARIRPSSSSSSSTRMGCSQSRPDFFYGLDFSGDAHSSSRSSTMGNGLKLWKRLLGGVTCAVTTSLPVAAGPRAAAAVSGICAGESRCCLTPCSSSCGSFFSCYYI